MSWIQTPKVELHLHLEGAMPPEFARRLAADQGISLDAIFDSEGNYAYTDFPGFLRTYEAACEVLRGPNEYQLLIEAVLAASAAQGVVYTEFFVSPQLCGGGGLRGLGRAPCCVERRRAKS